MPARFVERKNLRAELVEDVATTDLTLLCAPAGYGKTLLLADWIERSGKADKAWVFLDADDDNAERLLAAILCAIQECAAVPVTSSLRGLAPPRDGDTTSSLADLTDGIEALPGKLHLVLDDVHEVTTPGALHVLATLVRHQPRNLRLVLAGRSDPSLPLARWRVEGRLSELRAEQLRFSRDEAGELLRDAGIDLAEDQLRRLVEQTGGWAAGLRLAARSLRGTDDPEPFLTDCASNDRAMADFFAGEVLSRLAPDTRKLLRVLSICDGVTPQLAASLSGRADAGGVLAELERESSLVVAIGDDRQSYRIHPLLRAYLRADLSRHEPDLAGVLHARAASWYTARCLPMQALHHAEQTGDEQAVMTLLRDAAIEILVLGEPGLVRRALGALSGDAVAHDAWLLLFSALSRLESAELAAAESDIARAAAVWPPGADNALVTLWNLAISAYALACGRGTVRRRAVVAAPPGSAGWETWLRLDRGLQSLRAGDVSVARRELLVAEQMSRENDLDYLLMHCQVALAWVSAVDGDYVGMESTAQAALSLARAGGWQQSPWLAAAEGLRGLARLAHLDPVGATAAADCIVGAQAPSLRYLTAVVHGIARLDSGDRVGGMRLLQAGRRELGDTAVAAELAAVAALAEHECALRMGQHAVAREAAEWGRARTGATAECRLMEARAAFAHGDYAGTAPALREVLDPHARTLVPMTRVEARLLDAALALRAGRRTQARAALGTALSAGATADIIRPFAYADAAVRRLLLDQIGGFGAADAFACRVRRVLAGNDGSEAAGVLTGRERAVLARLTSPHPLDEVASELRVSVNTVKTHVRAIYAKLGVNNRRAAVVAARERGLS